MNDQTQEILSVQDLINYLPKTNTIVFIPFIEEYWITDGNQYNCGLGWIKQPIKGDGFLKYAHAKKYINKI